MEAVLTDLESAPIPERDKVLLAFIRKVNGASFALNREDVAVVTAAGWTDEAIYDAVSVCALFNFYNRWCDGAGVQPMDPEHHAMSGKRLAEQGYGAAPAPQSLTPAPRE